MKKVFLSPPHMGEHELEYIKKVFDSNYIAPLGEYVNLFEEKIREYTGSKYAVALSTATAGIHLALKVLGIKDGDEILASTFTFIGSVAPITYERCTPIFIDCDKESWNISPSLLQEFLERRKRDKRDLPKALILTHLYGQSADIEKIASICKENNIFLIEDAAESLGATFNEKQTGTFGDIGVYSFNGNKILTTSGGGILVTNNQEWAEKVIYYSTQARDPYLHYEHSEVGFNYRMSNVLAAIGVGQMEVLDERVKRKREIYETYRKNLQNVPVEFMPELINSKGNRWLTTLITPSQDTINTIIEKLNANSIESRPLWKPMHLQPVFKKEEYYGDRVSEDLFNRGICLPSGTLLTDNEIENICNLIKECL